MKIVHQAPGADLDWTVKAPLTFETPGGDVVGIESWSLAGLRWPEDAVSAPKAGTLSIPFQGVDIRFPVRLRQTEAGDVLALDGLSGRQRETLALFYRSLLSGRMASSDEVITSLDTPLDLVPMEETEAERTQIPGRKVFKSFRVVVNVMTYLLLAAAVVAIVGKNIFTNLDRIDIQHGRVVAPMAAHFPKRSGVVQEILVSPGQAVREGDTLVRMYDPKLHADLTETEARMAATSQAHDDVQQALNQLDKLTASDSPAVRMATASRYHALFVGAGQFDDMRRQWLALRDQSGDLAKTSDPVRIVRDMLAAELANRQADIDGLRAQRNAQLDLIALNHVTAPADGIVQDVLVRPGQPVSEALAPVAFEINEPRVTIGWVSERFAETMFIGMPASIGLNEGAARIKFAGTVTDLQAGDHPERPGEFGIIVTVAATDLSAQDTKTRFRAGAPVNLDAKRHIGQRLTAWFAALGQANG